MLSPMSYHQNFPRYILVSCWDAFNWAELRSCRMFRPNLLTWHFPSGFQKMDIERITRHVLQGQIFLQIEVSMPQNILIRYKFVVSIFRSSLVAWWNWPWLGVCAFITRDAIEVSREAEKRIMEVVPENVRVSMQLCLGQGIPHLNNGIGQRP